MTPKDKAIELVDIYKDITTTWIFKDTITTNVINYDLAKKCALIAVEQVLDEFSVNDEDIAIFWEGVKSEIRKL